MKDYWDSSAVIEACNSPALRVRLHRERGLARIHTLAEVFSTLTGGNLAFRLVQMKRQKPSPISPRTSTFMTLPPPTS